MRNLLTLNASSNYALGKYHEALSTYRDLLKHLEKERLWSRHTNRAGIMSEISLMLIKQDRVDQGLHWAWGGLNFLEMIGATTRHDRWFTIILHKYYRRYRRYQQQENCSPLLSLLDKQLQ